MDALIVLSDMPSGQDAAPEVEVSIDGAEVDTEQISVTIELYDMLQLYFIGIAIIILSVGASSMHGYIEGERT